MPIKVSRKDIQPSYANALAESIKRVCVNVMEYVGLEAVKEARDNHGYTDQTGNLTSSIGSVVVCDGKIGYHLPNPVKEGEEGASTGRKLLEEYAQKQEGDVELHVVAGMEYASYVEHGGRVVLSGAEVLVDSLLPKRMEESGLKIIKK